MENIKVSIIIPVYGVEKYIEQCLMSVFSQTYKNYECIIVDDRGNDHSIEIARDLICKQEGASSFHIITREYNGGLSAARNTGLSEANGDYVLFLDSDDMLFEDSVLTLVHYVEKYPNVDIVQGGIEVQNGKKYFVSEKIRFEKYSDDATAVRNNLINGLPQTSWAKLIRLKLLKDNNIKFKEGIIHEDELFRWELHKYAGSLCYTGHKTYWYRTDNQNSIMKSSNQLRSLRSCISIIKEIAPDIKTRPETEFAIYNLKLRKASRMNNIQDKRTITREINELRESTELPLAMRFELFMWNLPLYALKMNFVLAFCAGLRKIILRFSK